MTVIGGCAGPVVYSRRSRAGVACVAYVRVRRRSIVRQMLEHETDIVKDNGSTDMSPANYAFRFVREEDLNGQHSYVLEMLPWRKNKILLRGQIWVDSTTYLLHRTEGEPGCECGHWHAAKSGAQARMNPVKLTVLA